MFKKTLIVGAIVGTALFFGCDKIKEMFYQTTTDDNEKVAKVVRDQQEKERIRQNREWTPENKAKYPLEYLQSQIEEIDKAIDVLNAQKVIHLQNQANYKIKVNTAKDVIVQNEKTIAEIQSAVQASKTAGIEVIQVNGLTMTKDETARIFSLAKTKLESTKERLHNYEVALARVTKDVKINAEKLNDAVIGKEKLLSAIDQVKTQRETQKLEDVNISVDVTLASLGISDSTEVTLDDIQDSSRGSSAESEAYKELFGE